MVDLELHNELLRNKNDREVSRIELEQQRNNFAKYLIENKDKISNSHQPTIVYKKKRVRFMELFDKLKFILGFKNNKDYGTETYI